MKLLIAFILLSFTLLALLSLPLRADDSLPHSRQLIALDFEKTDLHSAFRTLAEISNLNIALHKDVHGHISLRLKNVSWEQAFEVLLRMRGLHKVREGDIIIVYPM